MIFREVNRIPHYSHHKEKILNACGGKEATAEKVLDYLLDDEYLWNKDGYQINKEGNLYGVETTLRNRIHMLWVFPVWLVCIPYNYLRHGDIGFSRSSWLGSRLIDFVYPSKNLD